MRLTIFFRRINPGEPGWAKHKYAEIPELFNSLDDALMKLMIYTAGVSQTYEYRLVKYE